MLKTLRARGLSDTSLKEIALALMVLDHIHYFFSFTGAVPEWFSMLGRVSAPLFLFCTAEGFAHTHDRRTYLLRLWGMGAGMGLVQFVIGVGLGRRADGFYPMNGILRDLTVACLLWQGIDWLRQRRLGRALALVGGVGVLWPVVSLALVAALPPAGQLPLYFLSWTVLPNWAFSTDGGVWFILGGVLLYALRGRRKIQVLAWAAWAFWIDMGSVSYLLLLLGLYDRTMSAISTLHLPFLLPLGIGLVLGIVLITRALERAMAAHPHPSYFIILGFLLGSVFEIFPGVPQGLSLPVCILTFAAGFSAIFFLSRMEMKKEQLRE